MPVLSVLNTNEDLSDFYITQEIIHSSRDTDRPIGNEVTNSLSTVGVKYRILYNVIVSTHTHTRYKMDG